MSNKNEFFRNGQRFSSVPVDLDELARQQGFDSFNDMQDKMPVMAQQLQNQQGGGNPGTTYNQVANKDDLATGRILGIIAATVGGGALASYLAGGAAGAGAGASAAPSLGASGMGSVGLTPGMMAALPTASMSAAPAMAAGGGATMGLGMTGGKVGASTFGYSPTAASSSVAPSATGGGFMGPTLQQAGRTAGQQTMGGNPYMNFLQSNGGSSLVSAGLNAVGNAAAASANRKQIDADRAQQLAIQQALMQYNSGNSVMQDQYARDLASSNAAPVGWAQDYEQKVMLKNLMLQRLLNGGGMIMSGNPAIDKNISQNYGFSGVNIPDEWKTNNPFSVAQTMASLANRQGYLQNLSGGRAPGIDFNAMNAPNAANLTNQTNLYQQNAAQNYRSNIDRLMEAVQMMRGGVNSARTPSPYYS